jgi:hypothetical protein
MNKKGSHVGMILSFAIFITFIVFLYSVLNPAVKGGEDKTATLSYIQMQIIENVSSNLTSATVTWTEKVNPNKKCVQLDGFLGFLGIPFPYKIIVKNENNIIQEQPYLIRLDSPDLEINRDDKDERFFRIYNSPEFDIPQASDSKSCDKMNSYDLGSVSVGGYVFEKKMYMLLDYYKNNYELLRTGFKVPQGSEFGFGFVQSNGTVIIVGEPPKSANVHVSEIPIQYVDEDVNVLSGFINIKVW